MERGSIYPSWRYHRTEKPELCHTPERDTEMGDEWNDTNQWPAEPAAEPEPAPKKKPGRKPKA